MNTKAETATTNKFDTFKWLLVGGVLGTGVLGFYYFAEYSLLLRVVTLLAIAGLAIFVALQTDKGRRTKDFLQQTHIEVRKVVWPTRQETLQMTGIVILMVMLVAIIIWLMDSFLFWLVRWFTGQGG